MSSYAADSAADICSCITVFHVTLEVSRSLKSLFEFICETLVQKASAVLDAYSCNNFEKFKSLNDKRQGLQLLLFILEALQVIFTHNRMDSILAQKYEDLVNALVALFEIQLEDVEMEDQLLEKVCTNVLSYIYIPNMHLIKPSSFFQLSDCLAELASCTEDETQWKYLNYQVLLNLRSALPKVG